MANEINTLVKTFIIESKNEEITIEDIFAAHNDFDPDRNRVDVLAALRSLETENLGVLAIGRHGKKTRFIKGAMRVKTAIDENTQQAISDIIAGMEDGQHLIVEKNGDLVLNDNIMHHDDDRTKIIECLRLFETDKIGQFIIGRRGAKSRFVKGTEKKQQKQSWIAKPNKNSDGLKYNIFENIIFKCVGVDVGFDSIEDLLIQKHIEGDASIIKQQLEANGYFNIKAQ